MRLSISQKLKGVTKTVFFGVTIMGLMSCSDNTEDLKAWVQTIQNKPAGRIKPMPEIVQYKPHEYQSSHLKSPFAELEPELESQLQALVDGCDDSVKPNINRRKEDLERYSLDSMEMVGVINSPDKQWGLIRMTVGPDANKVFHVRIGDYLGINHGQIQSIDEQQIAVSTLVPDSKGCWEKRDVFMALTQ